jgi:hypothetical protein
MSYQYARSDIQVVACDICNAISWVGDPQWRPMPHSSIEKPIHLCPKCRYVATWCDAHQQYHALDALHRRGCVDCGGLFTSIVQAGITRCPACRRAAGEQPPAATPPRIERPRTFLQRLFSIGANDH